MDFPAMLHETRYASWDQLRQAEVPKTRNRYPSLLLCKLSATMHVKEEKNQIHRIPPQFSGRSIPPNKDLFMFRKLSFDRLLTPATFSDSRYVYEFKIPSTALPTFAWSFPQGSPKLVKTWSGECHSYTRRNSCQMMSDGENHVEVAVWAV